MAEIGHAKVELKHMVATEAVFDEVFMSESIISGTKQRFAQALADAEAEGERRAEEALKDCE